MSRTPFATSLWRPGDPGRHWTAAGGVLLASVAILGGLLVGLPGGEPPTPEVVDATESTTTSSLLTAPDRLGLPLPGDDPVTVETILRHRRPGVEVDDATAVNTDEITTELSSTESGDTRLVVASSAVHQCGRYAGSIVVTASHPDEARDHLFIDLRFDDCDGISAVPAAPNSVNDTSRTWGDDGRAPWARSGSSTTGTRDPDTGSTSEPTAEPTTTEPTSEPTTTEPTTEPTDDPEPEPTDDPDPDPTTPRPGPTDSSSSSSDSGSNSGNGAGSDDG